MKKGVLLCVSLLLAHAACAQELTFELGYTSVSAQDSGASIDLGALYVAAGYAISTRGAYTNELEGSIWFGVADDSFGGATVNLKPSLEAGYRGRFSTGRADQSLFWRAVYTRITLEADSNFGSQSFIDSASGFGLGVGADYRGFTVGYTQYLGDLEDFSRISIGYRF